MYFYFILFFLSFFLVSFFFFCLYAHVYPLFCIMYDVNGTQGNYRLVTDTGIKYVRSIRNTTIKLEGKNKNCFVRLNGFPNSESDQELNKIESQMK